MRTNKDYLEKTFLEELNYKIWTTKGSRFNANKRLTDIAKLSNISISLLSVYLIATGLLTVYNLNISNVIDNNLLAYSVTIISILMLVFSQIENSKDYLVKAKEFHTCGLALSKIYNELRVFKTLNDNKTEQEKVLFAKAVAEKYEMILERFDNHEQIDFDTFKTRNPSYFELKKTDIIRIKLNYFLQTQLIFYILIMLPPTFLIYLIY